MKPQALLVAVDLVVLTVRARRLAVLLVRRGIEPHKGRLALPGGFVQRDEDLLDAAARELVEETGLADISVHLEQLGTYGTPGRDPRGRVIAVAYLALIPEDAAAGGGIPVGVPNAAGGGIPVGVPNAAGGGIPVGGPNAAGGGIPVGGSDAADAKWVAIDDLNAGPDRLAFDHDRILADGIERARAKLEYTPLAAAFCPPEFTINELRQVYEAVWGSTLDPRNFHRKVTSTADFVTPVGATTTRSGGRPAQLYRAGSAELLHPAMLRPERDPSRR